MARLDDVARDKLPDRAFAYVDSRGNRRLPIHDEAHVRNALARFDQVRFEDEAAKDRARKRLLAAAKRYGIVPVGFVDRQLRTRGHEAAAGRLVVELGRVDDLAGLQSRLRAELADPSLEVCEWSEANGAYLSADGQPASMPAAGEGRAVTLIDRHGRPMAALVHDPATLRDADRRRAVVAAVRPAVENIRLQAGAGAAADRASKLPGGAVTLLMSDIEGSTAIVEALGDRFASVLTEVRAIHRAAVRRAGGHEVDARADEYFAAFEQPVAAFAAAIAIVRGMAARRWPDDRTMRVRIGIHHGRPTRSDDGYVGLAVNTTARICAAGHGGQILVSRVARDAAEVAPMDARAGPKRESTQRLRPLGRYRLAGIHRPETIFQLEADGLDADFEALRAPTVDGP
ncbi:MAG TPA: adenylate/guanylate cyclase domain-containing protein [Candidatus Limnocylindrales bacterium]|jgi:class 3 adenylate cyclase